MTGPAFVLDPSRCTGCDACRVACAVENRRPLTRTWRTVHHANPGHHPERPTFHLSLACNHCERPACLEGCPASAYVQDPGTGAVLLDDAKCMGCRYCLWMCPYGAPRFEEDRGLIAKCTFCHARLLEGKAPSCAAACPTGALGIEARTRLPEPIFPGLPVRGLGPALRIAGSWPRTPECTVSTPWEDANAGRRLGSGSLGKEWSLVLFTTLCPLLVALQALWTLQGRRPLGGFLFMLLAGLAGAGSLMHLGRPTRAWRALAGLRTSWLSREILLFSLVVPASTAVQLLGRRGLLALLALALGSVLLLCIDRVYQRAEGRPFWRLRSAETLPSGLFLAGVAVGMPLLALPLALLRLAWLWTERTAQPPVLTFLRILGLAIPAAALAFRPGWPAGWVLAVAVLGESASRAAFYGALDLGDQARRFADLSFRGVPSAPGDPA